MKPHIHFMDKLAREHTVSFSVRFGSIEFTEMPTFHKNTVSCIGFSSAKCFNTERIEFTDDSSPEMNLRRDEDFSQGQMSEGDIIDGYTRFTTGRNFPCPYRNCKKIYTSSYGLKYHMDHGHTAEKSSEKRPYVCPVDKCGKTYKNNNGLKYHVQHAHKDHSYNESDYLM